MALMLTIQAGALLSVLSGVFWAKYKVFHLLPWICGLIVYLLPVGAPKSGIEIIPPIILGASFYFIAWASTLVTKRYSRYLIKK